MGEVGMVANPSMMSLCCETARLVKRATHRICLLWTRIIQVWVVLMMRMMKPSMSRVARIFLPNQLSASWPLEHRCHRDLPSTVAWVKSHACWRNASQVTGRVFVLLHFLQAM